MTRTSKLAYLSGMLDTGGFIGQDDGVIHKIQYSVHTGNTTRKVCKFLVLHFGGVFIRVPDDEKKIYYWKLTGEKALPSLLKELYPFLFEKKDDAKYVIQKMDEFTESSQAVKTRREIAAYQAGIIDATGITDKITPHSEDMETNSERFLLSIIPYLVEKKKEVNDMLQSLRVCTETTIT